MSIRDFDPLLKRAAARQASHPGGAKKQLPSIAETPSGLPLSRTPTKISIGARNIKISEAGSAADLGRQMESAFREISNDFRVFVEQLNGALVEDVAAALEPTLELAKTYCPKDTGALVASAYLVVEQFRDGARAEIGFARNNEPDYAVFVHEMPYKHDPPTTDHFLLKALNEDYFNIVQRLTDRVKARVG